MFKKALVVFALVLSLSSVCHEQVPFDIRCLYFTNGALDDEEQETQNIPKQQSVYDSPSLCSYHNAHGLAGINQMAQRTDSRIAQAYARQARQQYRQAAAEQSHLPPDFKDSFEHPGFFSKFGSHSKEAYEKAFHKKMVSTLGPNYSAQAATCYQRAEMRKWADYHYEGFREFIRSLPVYEEYMLEIAQECKQNQAFAQKLQNIEYWACSTIHYEEQRIIQKREKAAAKKKQQLLEHHNNQRHEIARDIFTQQIPLIESSVHEWEKHIPDRARAYHQVINEHDSCKLEYHDVSSQTQACLLNHGYNPENYTSLHGNALQQELLDEVIDGLQVVATMPDPHHQKSFDSVMYHTTFKLFDGARRVNEMGDCFGASQLIDLATTIVDYSAAVLEGIGEGFAQGAHDAVVGTYHMLRHPIKTAQALGKVAVCIAKLAHDYIPLQGPQWLCQTAQERAEYLKHQQKIEHNWADVDRQIALWWNTTPSREKIRQATKGFSNAITNAVVGHQCMQFASKICKLAATEAVALCRKVEQVEVATAGMPGDMSKIVSNSMSEAERIAESPATTLIGKVQGSQTIIEYGRLHNIPPKSILEALNNIECNAIQGCQKTLAKAIQEFGNMGSAKKVINIVLENSIDIKKFSTAKGAFWELESSLKLKSLGESIEQFSYMIGAREYDILTTKYLVECKNICWSRYSSGSISMDKLMSQLGNGVKNARDINRTFMLCTKNPIPHELTWFREWLIEKGIILIEGSC